MSRILIYCPRSAGHRLEYLHHLFVGASQNLEDSYIFAVAQDFYSNKDKFEWSEANNISFLDIPESFITETSNVLAKSYFRCKGLGWAVKQVEPDKAFVLDMIEYVPFLPLFVPSSVKVSGIIYRIYLYEWSTESISMKIQDWLKYKIFSTFRVYDRIFMLNDSEAAIELNRRFKSSKFKYLADPVAVINSPERLSIREAFNIPEGNIILLHPGGMLPYKGTLEILEALLLLDKEKAKKITVIFAGQVTKSIRERFFILFEKVKERVQVILNEGLLPFEKLGGYFVECDWVLIPYKIKSQSSGVVGHAAYFKKPVIAVKGGLIGNNVEKYKLGVLLDDASPNSIKGILENLPSCNVQENKYVEIHSIEAFTNTILH